MSTTSPKLLWLDLETTGTNTEDSIIEVGWILTDTDLKVLGESSSLVRPTPENWEAMSAIPPVVEMHTENGLVDAIVTGFMKDDLPTCAEVERIILEWLERNGAEKGNVYLAGSGVSHFDHRMLLHHMPELAAFCKYATLDVGVVRRMYEMFVGEVPTKVNDGKTHRALEDAYCHLTEARIYRNLWRAANSADVEEEADQ